MCKVNFRLIDITHEIGTILDYVSEGHVEILPEYLKRVSDEEPENLPIGYSFVLLEVREIGEPLVR